jgi:type I restriction enzyme S subunit
MVNYVTGSALPRIVLKDFKKMEFELPDLPTQTRIASVLSVYDDLIENNEKRIKALEEMAQRLYTEWFVLFRFPGYKKVKIVNNKIGSGKIPGTWNVLKCSEIIKKIVLGGTPARNNLNYWGGSIPWIKSGKLNEFRVTDGTEFITQEGLDNSATKLMPKRTVLVAITGAILVSISEIELCANQSVIGLYDSENLCQEYIYLYIKNHIKNFISKMSGSAQRHINKDIIDNSYILVPDPVVMEKFEKNIKPIFDLISTLLFKNKNLSKTRDLLIPQLVMGKREVK